MSNAPPLFNKGSSAVDTSQAVYSSQGRSRNTLSTSQSHSPQKNNVSGSRNTRYTTDVTSGPFSPSLDIISLNSHPLSDDDNHVLNSSFFEFQTDNDSSELSSELSSQDPQHIVPQSSNDAQQRFDSQLNMVRSRREQLQSSWDQDWVVFEPSENDDNYSLGDDLDDSSDNDNSYISEHERVIGLHLNKNKQDHSQCSGRLIPKSSCSSTPGSPRGATTPLAFPSHNGSGSFLDTLNKSVAAAASEIDGQHRRSLATSKDSDSLKPSLSSNNAMKSQEENLLVNFQSNNLRNYPFENHSSAKNKSLKSNDKEISTRYQDHATSTQVDGSLAITHGLQPVTAPQSDVFKHKNKQTHNAANGVKDSPLDDVLIPHIDNYRPLNHTFKNSSTGSPMNSVERVNAWRLNQSQHVLTELRKFERKRARKLSNSNSSFSSSANKVIDSLASLENIELARFKKSVSFSDLAQKYPTTPSTYSELAGSDLFSIDSAQNDAKKTLKHEDKSLKKSFGSLSDLSRLDINLTQSDGLGHEANSTTTPYKYDYNTANLAAAGERSESVPSSFKSEILASWGLPEEEQDEDFFLHNSPSAYYHQNRDIPHQDTSSKYDKPDLFQASVLSHNTENKDPAAVLADELYFILSSSTPNETAAQLLQLRNFTNHTLDLENVYNEQDGMIQGLGNLTQELGRLLGAAAESNKDMSRKVSKTKRHHRPNNNVDESMQEAGQNESFWQYITRKVLYNFIGLDDELLEVIVGDRFIDPDKQVNEGVLNGKHGLSTTNNAVGKLQKPSSILTSGNATPTKYNDYGNYLPRYNPSSETAFNENRTRGSALHGLISADKFESKGKCGEKEESESDDDDMTDIPDDRSEVYLDIYQRLDDIALATLNAINERFQKGNRSKSGAVVSWNQQLTTKISNELYAASAAIKKKYVFGSNKGKNINSSHRHSESTSQLDNKVSASAYQSFKNYSDSVENESVRLKKEEEPQSATALIVLEYLRVRLLAPFYSADILNGEQLIDTSTEESSVEDDDDDKTESKSPSDTSSKKSRSESGNNSSHQNNDDIKSDTQEHDASSESFGKKNSQNHAQVGSGASNSHNLNTSLGAIANKIFFRKGKEDVSVSETSSSHILSSVTNAEDGENSMTSSLLLKQTSSVVSGLVSSVISQQQQSACKLESRQQSLPDGEVGEEESASNYWEMGSFSTGSGSDIANLVGAW